MGRGKRHLIIRSEWRAPPTRGGEHRGMSTDTKRGRKFINF